jgi:hypothetical protein
MEKPMMAEGVVYMSNRTPAYLAAVRALNALAVEDRDAVDQAYIEAGRGFRRETYIKRRGVKPTTGNPFIERLTGARVVPNPVRFGWMDHVSLWIKDGKPFSFVTQPYGLSLEDLKEIVAYCEEHNLDVFVDAGMSWHYPGSTVAVELTREE